MARPFFNDSVTTPVDLGTGRIWLLRLVNAVASDAYLQVFDVPAASVVLGTTKPVWVVRVKASSEATIPMAEPTDIAGPPAGHMSIASTTTATGATTTALSVCALVT